MGLAAILNWILNEVFPDREPTLAWNDTWWRRGERRETIRLFGIDPERGQAGVLHQFGRPLKALYFPPAPSLFGRENVDNLSGPSVREPLLEEGCVYTYPTFEIRFHNKLFSSLEIFARDIRFPLGVAVGDSEQHLLDVLGPPPFHHATGDWIARYDFWVKQLEIEIKNGRVVRMSW